MKDTPLRQLVRTALGLALLAGPLLLGLPPATRAAFPFDDTPAGLAMSPDATVVYMTGTTQEVAANLDDVLVVARQAPTGIQLWQTTWDGGLWDFAMDIAVSPDGATVYVVGATFAGAQNEVLTLALDASTGAVLWSRQIPAAGPFGAWGIAVAVAPDSGTVFVAGETHQAPGDYDWVLEAYDTTGTVQWTQTYTYTSPGRDTPADLVATNDLVVATGHLTTGALTGTDLAIAAYDHAGTLAWDHVETSLCTDSVAVGVAAHPDNDKVFIAGTEHYSLCVGAEADYHTIGYDLATGLKLWDRLSLLPGKEVLRGIATIASREVYVTGSFESDSPLATTTDYLTIAYDGLTGVPLWTQTYDAGGDDFATAITAGYRNDGFPYVFVTGEVRAGAQWDVATVSYEFLTGTLVWDTVDNGPPGLDDRRPAIALGAFGFFQDRVFITSASQASANDLDAWTTGYGTANGAPLWDALDP